MVNHDQKLKVGAEGNYKTDVAIVGAGFSGLAAAKLLQLNDVPFLVLEARDRVGGRVLNHPLKEGGVVEEGGQWIGPTQDKIRELALEMGVATFHTYDEGRHVYYQGKKRMTYKGTIPPAGLLGTVDLGLAIARLNQMAKQVPLENPYLAPKAKKWDTQTFQSWMERNAKTKNAKKLLTLAIEAVFSCDPGDISLLHVLFYIHSAGNLDILISVKNGAQQERFVGGSQLVAERLAEKVSDRLLLSSPVKQIEQSQSSVHVVGEGFSVEAKFCIMAIPPTLTGKIEYIPDLPPLRKQLVQRVPMGTVYKVQVVYPAPFWREQGLSGQTTSDTGPIKLTFDNSPPDGKIGVLLGFIEGDDGRRVMSLTPDERKDEALRSLENYFGKEVWNYTEYIEKNWSEETYSGGGYGGFFPPGVWTGYGAELRRPIGRIYWAGTETSPVWNGYMDGAIRSGEMAAGEILKLCTPHNGR